MLLIRPGTVHDADAISRAEVATKRATAWDDSPIAPRPWAAWITNTPPFIKISRRQIFVAVETSSGDIVGHAACRHGSTFPPYQSDLTSLSLLPAYHGRGLGRQLFAQAVRWLASEGVESLSVEAFVNNPHRQFYDRMGGEIFTTFGSNDELVVYGWQGLAAWLETWAGKWGRHLYED